MRAHLAHATILCALVTSACGAEPAVATDTATATAPPGDTATSAPPDTATGDDGAADVGERDGDAAPAVAIVGARLLGAPGVADGGVAVLVLEGGVIARVGGDVPAGAEVVDLSGRFVVPAFIDSHVHLLYR
ncbi:MAG: hypothetical protein KC635_20550, partial [Myxococcales bacterium]|nr:hypothetical protein [Myxococcales bacterium]